MAPSGRATLAAIHIANFKAFGHVQRIPLRPITLVYGANSAGKSSLLHTLVWAHHANETGDLEARASTRVGGESVDLGGFRQFLHRHERRRRVELAFELEHLPPAADMRFPVESRAIVKLEIGHGGAVSEKGIDSGGARVGVTRFAVDVDGDRLFSLTAADNSRSLRLDSWNSHHNGFREILSAEHRAALHADNTAAYRTRKLQADLQGFLPRYHDRGSQLTFTELGLADWEDESFPLYEGFPIYEDGSLIDWEDHEDPRARAARAMSRLMNHLSNAVANEVERLFYLGPLRTFLPRDLAFVDRDDPNHFAGGAFAWQRLRDDGTLRKRLNEWLGDPERLNSPYELQIRLMRDGDPLASALGAKLRPAIQDIVNTLCPSPDEPSAEGDGHESLLDQYLQRQMDEMDQELGELVLLDKRSQTLVSHRDIGIGVSQVLPVLVAAYGMKRKRVAIEQPEIHLHPALQAELGDVFIESALGAAGNQFVIETHSEHLLLRIMRRMRQTANGEPLPEGIPQVRPEDVCVLFVEPDGTRSIVREMPLNERGELVRAWPGGFFEEGIREIF